MEDLSRAQALHYTVACGVVFIQQEEQVLIIAMITQLLVILGVDKLKCACASQAQCAPYKAIQFLAK